MIKIVQWFNSIQGEGPTVGKPSLFIRLPLCNLNCKWCDSKYALTDTDVKQISLNDIKTKLHNIVITGGEPLINQNTLELTYNHFNRKGNKFQIQTNGTFVSKILSAKNNVYFNISPKLSNAGITRPYDNSTLIKYLQSINNNNYIVKFVVSTQSDMQQILEYVKNNNVPNDKVYLMPEGVSRQQQEQKSIDVINYCLKYNFTFTPRLHILVWNTKRGV